MQEGGHFMKTNKKGMTLVECIVAMAVFAIATTGFTMAATACMRAQAKSHKRMTKTNVQSTNLEHFSTNAHVLDPEYSNIKPMTTGANQFKITFPFKTSTVENKNVYGYYAKLDSNDKEGVYQLSFLSAVDQIKLTEGEYWVTLYNCTSDGQEFTVSCDEDYTFFDNEHNISYDTSLPGHLWSADGGYRKFGVKNLKGTGAKITITRRGTANPENDTDTTTITIDSSWMPNGTLDNGGDGDNMVSIYYVGGDDGYLNLDGYNALK
jgi:prepilin-type N-terminal cleavage/methylation domain-containing protein